jgi:hypothetical protein
MTLANDARSGNAAGTSPWLEPAIVLFAYEPAAFPGDCSPLTHDVSASIFSTHGLTIGSPGWRRLASATSN